MREAEVLRALRPGPRRRRHPATGAGRGRPRPRCRRWRWATSRGTGSTTTTRAGSGPRHGSLGLIRDTHRFAEEAWRLPLHGGFAGFRHVVDLPFVARHSQRPTGEVRARLGIGDARRVALVSFGGFGLRSMSVDVLARLGDFDFIVTEGSLVPQGERPAGTSSGRRGNVVSVNEHAGTPRAGGTRTWCGPPTWWSPSRATGSSPSAWPTTRPWSTRRAGGSSSTMCWWPWDCRNHAACRLHQQRRPAGMALDGTAIEAGPRLRPQPPEHAPTRTAPTSRRIGRSATWSDNGGRAPGRGSVPDRHGVLHDQLWRVVACWCRFPVAVTRGPRTSER